MVPFYAGASEKYEATFLIDKAKVLKLNDNPVWHKLLSYERSSGAKSVKSTIHQDVFFNSNEGKRNSKAELDSTIRAFLFPINQNENTHAVCRFPARFLWLKKHLNLSSGGFPTVNCSDFQEWTIGNSIRSISIVFASGYMGNPGSYYGHVLLKLNSGKLKNNSHLLDQTINYGVIFPESDDPLSYMVKGVFGGYEGGFSRVSYDFHNKNYGEIELRDMWEYELSLDKEEVDFIVAHAWEVLGKTHTYYFFKENCVSRLAELLEVVDGIKIEPENPFFILPQALIKKLASSKRNGEPLLRSIKYHPSRQTKLYTNYLTLDKLQQRVVHAVVMSSGELESDSFNALGAKSQKVVLATLLDYFEYAKSVNELTEVEIQSVRQKVLLKRFQLTPGENSMDITKTSAPHVGREASFGQFGVISNQKFGEGFSFRVRPTYYDALDVDSGLPSNSNLSMGDTRLVSFEGGLKIRELNVVRIESVNGAVTGLPGDSGKAWKLALGLTQQNLSCLDCLTMRFEADYGWTIAPTPMLLLGAYAGGIVQDNRKGVGNFFAKGSVFLNARLSKNANTRLSFEVPKSINGSKSTAKKVLVEARYRLGLNSDVRFLYQKHKASEYQLSLGYYF